jgi:transcriptional antiterminator RfaH
MGYWACAQLEPNRTALALHCLGLNGFEVYCPRLREQCRGRGRKIVRTPPLFPGYLFLWVVSGWWNARWSPGVRRLVMDGLVPARVPDDVINEIRSRERGGLVELPKLRLEPGARVRVLLGPLRDQIGLLAALRPHERVLVLGACLAGFVGRLTAVLDAGTRRRPPVTTLIEAAESLLTRLWETSPQPMISLAAPVERQDRRCVRR